MKKIAFRLLCVILFCVALNGSASDNLAITGFTHPEIGEFIVYDVDNGMPSFTIYGFTQYKVMNPQEPYRGVQVLNKNRFLGFDDTLNGYFDNIINKDLDHSPVVFEYTGLLQQYTDQLETLPKQEKINAIKYLSGFEGTKGFSKLHEIEGLEYIDINYLEDNYNDYTVDINGKTYPYRILMFYIEEEDWQESYYERYHFIKQGNNWNLFQICKEYASEYPQRNKYIHGLAGSILEMYESIQHDALRGSNWFSTKENVAALENVSNKTDTITISNTKIFRLPADLTYNFKDSHLSKIEYKMPLSESYYSAVVSLYMRYYDPVTILDNGTMIWFLPDMNINLSYENETLLLTFTPMIDFEAISTG